MVNFDDIKNNKNICLYAGDIYGKSTYELVPFIGLSLTQNNMNHIRHDVTQKMDLLDNSVDIYQPEDVFEHIEYNKIPNIFSEIYRILKPGGLFRLSMPDYRCNVLYDRSNKDLNGNILFDVGGGGLYDFENKKVIDGGHVWFPKYESVFELFRHSNFDMEKVEFLHYYDETGKSIINDIDYTKGYIGRTPDHDKRVQSPRRPMSIVVDAYK